MRHVHAHPGLRRVNSTAGMSVAGPLAPAQAPLPPRKSLEYPDDAPDGPVLVFPKQFQHSYYETSRAEAAHAGGEPEAAAPRRKRRKGSKKRLSPEEEEHRRIMKVFQAQARRRPLRLGPPDRSPSATDTEFAPFPLLRLWPPRRALLSLLVLPESPPPSEPSQPSPLSSPPPPPPPQLLLSSSRLLPPPASRPLALSPPAASPPSSPVRSRRFSAAATRARSSKSSSHPQRHWTRCPKRQRRSPRAPHTARREVRRGTATALPSRAGAESRGIRPCK